jgi:GNAT superfamily N-acetyltransferase
MLFDSLIKEILKKEGSSDQLEWDRLSGYWKEGNVIVEPSIWENSLGRYVRPNKIIIPKEKRNQGLGTKVLQSIITLADSQERTLVLSPSTDFGASSVERLKRFYKRFGFVENRGRNKDFGISQTLYRIPTKNKNFTQQIEENFQESSIILDIPRQTVFMGRKAVATLEVDEEKKASLKYVLSLFEEYPEIQKFLKTLKLNDRFPYVWINLIKVLPQQRGKGLGSLILKRIFSKYPSGSLIALNVGEVSSGKSKSSIQDLISFYQKLGFQIVKSEDDYTYAFKIL